MNKRTNQVLFLCTDNSSCSQLAEALANVLNRRWVRACSAGSRSSGHIQSLALKLIEDILEKLDRVAQEQPLRKIAHESF